MKINYLRANKWMGWLLALLLLASCQKEDIALAPDPEPPTADTIPQVLPPATAYIFDIDKLPEISLQVKQNSWNNLLAYFDQNPDNEEYIMGRFSFVKDGENHSLDSIGLRIRGNTSRRRPEGSYGQPHNPANPDWHHAHFALKFTEFVKGKMFSGTDRFNLKWFKDDAMYAREVYCYDLFERFGVWTAPQSSYCRLNIHVEGDAKPAYFGVYQMVEAVQDYYLADRVKAGKFKGDKGFLWKCSWGADLVPYGDVRNKMGVEEINLNPSLSKSYVYDLKTGKKQLETAKDQLQDFMRQLNNLQGAEFKAWIEQKMDMELFLKTYAVNVAVGMWDDYWGNNNNYYLYFDVDGKVYFIPYDYDNTLGTSLIVGNAGTKNPLYWGPDNGRPLLNKILAVPEFRARYVQHLKDLAREGQGLFGASDSQARIRYWQQRIAPHVSNDTGEDMQLEDKPASWGNAPYYRLLSGNAEGGSQGNANFFGTRIKAINQL